MLIRNIAVILLAVTLASCAEKPAENPAPLGPQTALRGVAAVDHFISYMTENGVIDKSDTNWKLKAVEPNQIKFDPAKKVYWLLETTKGPLKFELFHKSAPRHVTSTIYLTRLGFYDDLSIHRIVSNFIIQGGCPIGDGRGGPAYRIDGEFGDTRINHGSRGMLSAANAGPGTDGSQFFVTSRPCPSLDGKHTVYGRIVEGESTIIKLDNQGTPGGVPRRAILIKKATIIEE